VKIAIQTIRSNENEYTPGKLLLPLFSKEGVTVREWLSAIGNICRELAYGFDAGNAIQHGLPTPPSPKLSPSRTPHGGQRSREDLRRSARLQYQETTNWHALDLRPFVPDDLSDVRMN